MNGRGPKKTYMWVAVGGPEHPVVYFRHGPGRGTDVIVDILGKEPRDGFLQSDGARMYERYCSEHPGMLQAGCWQHARRPFVKILRIENGGQDVRVVDSSSHAPARERTAEGSLALKFVTTIARLYIVEKELRKKQKAGKLTDEEFLEWRKKSVAPVFAEIRNLVDINILDTPKRGLLGKGLRYISDHWKALVRYVEDPHLGPDNGASERAIRPFAVGRRNWLFSETERGARASAVFYTLVETAKANKLRVWDYLHALFKRLPAVQEEDRMEELLPWNIAL